MAFADDDIPTMLDDMGVAVVAGSVTAKGIFDEKVELQIGEVIMSVPAVTVQTSVFPNLEIDSAIAVNGKNFKVRERSRVGDGGLTTIFLKAA